MLDIVFAIIIYANFSSIKRNVNQVYFFTYQCRFMNAQKSS